MLEPEALPLTNLLRSVRRSLLDGSQPAVTFRYPPGRGKTHPIRQFTMRLPRPGSGDDDQHSLEQAIDRAVKDQAFRQLLLTNPDKALAGYHVTDEDRQILYSLNEDAFEEFAGSLGNRSTKGFLPGTG